MAYPKIPELGELSAHIIEFARVAHENGNEEVGGLLDKLEKDLTAALENVKNLAPSQENLLRQPSDLQAIVNLRDCGPRKQWQTFDQETYADRLEGALLGRLAGCTLGAPVEFWEIADMESWAKHIGDTFPPVDYWSAVPYPHHLRYLIGKCEGYTRDGMDGVPVDDDTVYTLLGLLIAEECGLDFTTADVGKTWLKYLPMACTAEDVALRGMKAGADPMQLGGIDNAYRHWIGADIRCDPFAYMAPAYPEKAAELAYRDAYLSHRQNGLYGAMFFAAAISAAFALDDPIEALKVGLSEIPRDCDLARDVRWALEKGKEIKNYKDARAAVEERFVGMSAVHTNNNACLTIFGLMIGDGDFVKTVSETVAMGMDNDCTAATAGSLLGACKGKAAIPARFAEKFNNTIRSYFHGNPVYQIDDILNRFTAQAQKVFGQ